MYMSRHSPGGTSHGMTFSKDRFGVRSTTLPSSPMAKAATGSERSKSRYRLSSPVRHMNQGPWMVNPRHSM